MKPFLLLATTFLCLCLAFIGCDTDITGSGLDNQPPETDLSVRDTDLTDNIGEDDRFSSTVQASWSGTDPDGFVALFEIRFYPEDESPASAEEGWASTVRNDSLVLLPIPRGNRDADVVFEVRSVDNQGLRDPTPARTIFPIRNAPPSIRLSLFEQPPDTTLSIISFSYIATDPEGPSNLSRIEVSLNDSTSFTALPPDVDFITLVGQEPAADVTEARVFTGRAFRSSSFTIPDLRLDAENTFYLRAVDQTDTTSTLQSFTWFAKKADGEVLYVNDYRKNTAQTVQDYHVDLLREYLPVGAEVDVWNVSTPFATGSSGIIPRSDQLPVSADPTLRQQLRLYNYIYWVTTASTNNVTSNNLPFAAGVMDLFFEQGGKLMVHTPISLPTDIQENTGNPAILLLPLSDLLVFPDTLRPQLRLPSGANVNPVQPVPGVGQPLPPLVSQSFLINTLPFIAVGENIVPLYEAEYRFLTLRNRQGPWTGPSTVASISADRRVGLFALPLVNEQTGAPILAGTDGTPDAGREAVQLMLQSLGFPGR